MFDIMRSLDVLSTLHNMSESSAEDRSWLVGHAAHLVQAALKGAVYDVADIEKFGDMSRPTKSREVFVKSMSEGTAALFNYGDGEPEPVVVLTNRVEEQDFGLIMCRYPTGEQSVFHYTDGHLKTACYFRSKDGKRTGLSEIGLTDKLIAAGKRAGLLCDVPKAYHTAMAQEIVLCMASLNAALDHDRSHGTYGHGLQCVTMLHPHLMMGMWRSAFRR